MIVDRRVGDRLKIEILAVGGQRPQIHLLMESDLSKAWLRVCQPNNPRQVSPRFTTDGEGWIVISSLTGERLANMSLTPPARGKPRP